MATHDHHRTPLEVTSFAMRDGLALDDVLLGCEEDYEKVGLGKYAVVCYCCTMCMLSDKELDILDPVEVVGGVYLTATLSPRTQKG